MAYYFSFFSFNLFTHDAPSAKNIYLKNKDKDECISNHTVLPGGHVSRGLRCLISLKIVSNLLFEKCSRFHISSIVWDIIQHLGTLYEKPFLVISSLGRGICRSFALLTSYFET